jgi:hypothetical protein
MINEVEEYLRSNPHLKLSIKNLSKRLYLKTRQTCYLAYKSKYLRRIDPLEVGSLKFKTDVFTFSN